MEALALKNLVSVNVYTESHDSPCDSHAHSQALKPVPGVQIAGAAQHLFLFLADISLLAKDS